MNRAIYNNHGIKIRCLERGDVVKLRDKDTGKDFLGTYDPDNEGYYVNGTFVPQRASGHGRGEKPRLIQIGEPRNMSTEPLEEPIGGWNDDSGPNPAPTPPIREAEGLAIFEDCEKALAVTKKNAESAQRAFADKSNLKMAAETQTANPFTWEILAAIGIRESDYKDVPEIGGGPGRGVFQESLGGNAAGSYEGAKYQLATKLGPRYNEYAALGYSAELSFMASLRRYNRRERFTPMTIDVLSKQTAAGTANPSAFDRGTAKGNYVSNVIDIAKYCFGYKFPF